jgi:hypothetical protein
LSFVGDQRIFIHGLHYFRIASESLVRQVQNVGMWRKVAQPFKNRKGLVLLELVARVRFPRLLRCPEF